MLDLERMRGTDSSRMFEIYDRWPEISRQSYDSEAQELDFADIDHIIFCGMGGSGTLGDIFSSILSKTDTHVHVSKGYLIPKTADRNTLVVASSVSGNTMETLTALQMAHGQGCKTASFSSGGMMAKFCTERGLEFRQVPSVHSPRSSLTRYVYTILKTLRSVIPISSGDIEESMVAMDSLAHDICSENLSESNPSLQLARWIRSIPLIYYPAGLQASAIRFKNSLQENTKSHAMAEDIIEACHNGIVSWETPSGVQPILLEGHDDFVKTRERWAILREFFDSRAIEFREVRSVRGNILAKQMHLIYLLDYASIYLAVLRGVDPSPVGSIDYVKDRL